MIEKPTFNVIDDGWSLYVAKNTTHSTNIQGWINQILIQEASVGRVRPLYYLYYIFIWFFSESNPIGYWLAQTSLAAGLLILMYFIEKPVNKSQAFIRFIGVSMIFLFPSFVTNYFRLGTAEPRQVLLILISMGWLFTLNKHVRSHLFVLCGILLYVASLLTKETSLSLFPAIILQLFFISYVEKRYRKKSILLIGIFTIISLFFFGIFAIIGSNGYGAGAGFSLSTIKLNLLSFRIGHRDELLLLTISTFILALHLANDLKNKKPILDWVKKYRHTALYVSALVGQMFFLLVWTHQLERYFLIFDVLLILIFLHSITHFLGDPFIINRNRIFFYGFGFFCWCIVWYVSFFKGYFPDPIQKIQSTIMARKEAICSYQENGYLIDYLISKDFSNTSLYVLHNDYEVIYEINLFATKFNPRFSLQVISGNNDLVKDFSSKFPQLTYSSDLINEFNSDKNKKIIFARSESHADAIIPEPKGKKIILRANHKCEKQLNWVVWE